MAIAFVELIWIGAQDTPIESLARYSFSFLLGVNFYHWRSVIPTAWWTILPTAIVTYAINKTGFEAPALILLCGQLGIVLGTRDSGLLSKWTRKTDISYGAYICGWPVQQIIVPLCRNMAPMTFALVSVLIVMSLGYLSWRLVAARTAPQIDQSSGPDFAPFPFWPKQAYGKQLATIRRARILGFQGLGFRQNSATK